MDGPYDGSGRKDRFWNVNWSRKGKNINLENKEFREREAEENVKEQKNTD